MKPPVYHRSVPLEVVSKAEVNVCRLIGVALSLRAVEGWGRRQVAQRKKLS